MNQENKQETITLDLVNIPQQDEKRPLINWRKYLILLSRRRTVITLLTLVFAAAWGISYSLFYDDFAEYRTSVVIRFDDPRYNRGISAVTDFSAGMETGSKVAVLHTNSFMGLVVDSLALTMEVDTRGVRRSDLFKAVRLGKSVNNGEFNIRKYGNLLEVNYAPSNSAEPEKLFSSTLPPGDSIVHVYSKGTHFALRKSALDKHDEIDVDIIPRHVAIAALRDRIESELDRTRTILTIAYTDNDPVFSARVTNTISNLFIQQLWQFKRYQTSSIIHSLREQLTAAQSELVSSETTLQSFRERNPYIFLENEGQRLISKLAELQLDMNRTNEKINEIKNVRERIVSTADEDAQNIIYQEMLTYMATIGMSEASVYQAKLGELLSERERLLAENYSARHPLIAAIEKQIRDLKPEIKSRISGYEARLVERKENLDLQINSENRNLQSLPGDELKLAELQRQHAIKERIVTNIMERYNEAKVADAAVIPDAYIIDEAQPPMREFNFWTTLKSYALGLMLGLVLSVVVVLIVGVFDRRFWTPEDIGQILLLPVLATIPKINVAEKDDEFSENTRIEPKLITADYSPTLAGEAFRKLRTVMEIDANHENKAMLIASLNPGEGKSLMAANVAISYAQQRHNTLLIDGDIRKGVLHSTFALEKEPGLTELLASTEPITEELIKDYIRPTHVPHLFLLPSGKKVPNPSELLGNPRMKKVLEILNERFDRLIADTPPFIYCPDLFVINKHFHNIVLVMRSEKTNLTQLHETLSGYAAWKNDIRGVIVNGSRELEKKESQYKYSYYAY
jgi:succinoglycan biosynthesis transport protein ExoP